MEPTLREGHLYLLDKWTYRFRGPTRGEVICFRSKEDPPLYFVGRVIALSGDGRIARVDLGIGGGVLLGELRQDSRAAIIEANLTSVDLGTLIQDMRGRVTGRLSLRGAGDDLSGSANITVDDIRSIDSPRGLAVDGTVNALLVNNTLRIQANAADGDAVRAVADVTLPVEATAAPLRLAIVRTRDMTGEISIQGQIQPIWDLLAGGERSLRGATA